MQRPGKKKILQNKWVYRMKHEANKTNMFKARFVMNRFGQKKCIDINEIFALVVKLTSIRTMLSIVVVKDLHL